MKAKALILTGTVGAIFALILFAGFYIAYGQIASSVPTQNPGNFTPKTFFSATTTNATSTNGAGGYLTITGAKRLVALFQRGDTSGQGNSGSSRFRLQVTPDGSTWFDFGRLQYISGTTTADAYFKRFDDVTLTGTTTQLMAVDLNNQTYYGLRCIVLETTDGEHTCKAYAEY
jgi:hypothetical protein